MAKLNITITDPIIDLIRNFNEMPTECYSLYTFDILTTNGASIVITLTLNSGTYNYATIDIDGTKSNIVSGGTVTLPNGTAKVEVRLDNVTPTTDAGNEIVSECNDLSVDVTDNTNTKSEFTGMFRCDTTVC